MFKNNRSLTATLVTDDLGPGGAERVLALMANYWARNGWQISFMTLNNGNAPHFWNLDPAVDYVDFNWSQIWRASIPKMRMLCTLISLRAALQRTKPDVIISFLNTTNVSVLMATYKLGIPVIVSERNDPHLDTISTYWERRRRWFYPMAACVVAQTQNALDYFSPRVQAHGCVIPNPVWVPDVVDTRGTCEKADLTQKEIIAVGRLTEQKGFDLLITAFARVAATSPDWSLTIWGEGPEQLRLETMVRNLGLEGKVRLPGKTQQIYAQLKQADLFVLSSRYEGFPNALCEAMACGLPVISFDCPSGPGEIIRNGVDGVLVPPGDTDTLANAIQRLMNDEALRERLAGQAPQVLERFSLGRIMSMWESLISTCVKR